MTMDFKPPVQHEIPKRRISLIEMAKEEVEQAQTHSSQPNNRENCVNYANQFIDKIKNFASKVYSKNQKDGSEKDARLTKYDMTDFLIHNEELYQEFKELLAHDHIVTHVAVNEELNKFLLEKVEKIMLEKIISTPTEKKVIVSSSNSSDATAECSASDEDERIYRLVRQRSATVSHDDGSVASSANDSATRHTSWEPLFEKMNRRISVNNPNDTTTTTEFLDCNNTVTGISSTRLTRSLTYCSTAGSSLPDQTPKRETLFRDDSFLCKLTVANTIPYSVNVENNNDNNMKMNQFWNTSKEFDFNNNCHNIEQQRYNGNNNVGDCESTAFRKMRRRIPGP